MNGHQNERIKPLEFASDVVWPYCKYILSASPKQSAARVRVWPLSRAQFNQKKANPLVLSLFAFWFCCYLRQQQARRLPLLHHPPEKVRNKKDEIMSENFPLTAERMAHSNAITKISDRKRQCTSLRPRPVIIMNSKSVSSTAARQNVCDLPNTCLYGTFGWP